MPISLSCGCGRSLRAKDELAGRKVKCPQCGATLAVPEAEEVGLLPLNDPWKEAPPHPKEPQPTLADDQEISEVLPADPDEEEGDEDEDEVSQRERIRRREEREKERAEEERGRRRRKRQREEDYQELVEKGRFRVRGSRGYLENINSGIGAGICMIGLGLGLAFFSMLMARAVGGAVIVIPVGLIVGGIAAIAVGLNRR